jgi:hypothetical protein
MTNRSTLRTRTFLRLIPALAVPLFVCPRALFSQHDSPLIDTRSASTAMNVHSQAVENLPAARDPWSILQVAPGVATDQGIGAGSSGMGNSVSGGSSALMTIDGIAVGDPSALGNSQTYVPFTAIQEIQVQTGGAGAEYGRDAIGGVIRIVTKGGTNEWQGSGQVLGGSGEDSGQSFANGRFEVMLEEGEGGGYCLQSFEFRNGGTHVPGPGSAPFSFGFDRGFTIGADPSAQTPFAGGGGNLFTYPIPPCPGAATGMSFVDSPTPVTPPTPTHLYFGQNGVFAVDMYRVAARYRQDPGLFDRSYFLHGSTSFTAEGFQRLPGAATPPVAGNGLFVYGIDTGGESFATNGPVGDGLGWNPYGVQLQGGTPALPDADGDGQGDSFFIRFSGLQAACPNVTGGAFTSGGGGSAGAGGYLQSGAGAARPDCDYLKDWGSLKRDFQLSGGLRYDLQGGGRAGVFGADDAPGAARTGGAFRTDFGARGDLGGPIVKDKLWIWGAYGLPETKPAEKEAPLFSFDYWSGYPRDFAQRFAELYTTPAVGAAPAGQGVQEVELEIRFAENADGAPIDYTPGGAPHEREGRGDRGSWESTGLDPVDTPLLYVVAQGGATGEVFQVEIVQPASGPVAIDGLVALEPVAATAEDRERFERELDQAGGSRRTLTAAGYCLQMDALAPPAGTVFRVAPAEKQARYAPMRRALDAARRLRDAGGLHPDSDPEGYYHSIRQWAVWTVEKGFDRDGFLGAFVERTEENFRDAGQPWSEEVAAAVRSFGEGRWSDIQAILEEAEAESP